MPTTILQWNCRGIQSKMPELRQWLTANPVDIICIQETHLKADNKCHLPGYTVIRKDRPIRTSDNQSAKGGGLCFMLRTGLNHVEQDTSNDIECQVIKVTTTSGRLHIANVYLPPGGGLTKQQQEAFEDLLVDRSCLLVGDLNARSQLWGCPDQDLRGKQISEIMEERGLVCIGNGQPTHLHHTGSTSIIDLAFTSPNIALDCKHTIQDDLMRSDHMPILIQLGTQNLVTREQLPKWRLEKADWSVFEDSCRRLFGPHIEDGDTEVFNDRVTEAIIKATEESIPQTRPGRQRQKPLPYWNDEIRKAIVNRNKAGKKMRTTRDVDDCIEYRRLGAVVRRTIRSAGTEHWRAYCETLSHHTRLTTVWNMARRMNGSQSNAAEAGIIENGHKLDGELAKANAFAKRFAEVSATSNYTAAFQHHKLDIETNHRELFENNAPETDMSRKLNVAFTSAELETALGLVRKNKTPGGDRIVYELLQRLPAAAKRTLLRLYNLVWSTGNIPKPWRHAIVIPILKSGKDPKNASSYRPISLTSCLCKTMERMVANRMMWYIEKHGLMSRVQSGFRRHRSTIDQVARLHDTIVKRLNTKGHVLAVFLDMEKAFDIVWRKGLMIKLKRKGINGRMFQWMEAFLSDRTIQVRVGSTLSETVVLENGTAQGAMISPSAFISMIDDLPENVETADTSLFADDGMLFVEGRNKSQYGKTARDMQTALNNVYLWCETWGFKLSSEKSVAVLFTQTSHQTPELLIDGRSIKFEKSARFLGMTFDQKLTWKPHIENIKEACRKRLNLLRAISGKSWGADMSVLRTVYLALIRSRIAYGSEVYGSTQNAALLGSLERIQNRALRTCCGAMKCTPIAALQVECRVMPLALHRLSLQTRFAIKVKATAGHVANTMFKAHWTHAYMKRRRDFFTNRVAIAVKTEEFFSSHPQLARMTQGPQWPQIPPWIAKIPNIDTSLTLEVSKHDEPVILAAIANEKIEKYRRSHQVHIYTDASRTTAGKVGIGCVFRGVTTDQTRWSREYNYRITDDASVLAGELSAITMAFQKVFELNKAHGWNTFVLYSDSLSTIKCFERGRCPSRPNLFNAAVELYNKTEAEITLVWVPSHIGIHGNESADKAADKGAKRQVIDIAIGLELAEAYTLADRYIEARWQSEWTSTTAGSFYRQIEPKVQSSLRPKLNGRALQTTAHRLRFGKCCVNAVLHNMALHPTGLCDQCKTPETVEHLLLGCTGTVSTAVAKACTDLGIQPNIVTVLSNAAILTVIHKAQKNRRL